MKKFLFLIAIFCALKTNAQNYLITFAGTGASTTVNSVKVENLTSGTSLILNGDDILNLSFTTGFNSIENKRSVELKTYPNPMTGSSILQFYPPEAGDAVITVSDLSGKTVFQVQKFLENILQEFRLSGLNNGYYLIIVKGRTYQYSGKILCSNTTAGTIRLEKISTNQSVAKKTEKMDSKGVQSSIEMAYATGDRLKFTGISGNYGTVMTDIPTGDKTITFDFIACTDADNYNYPIVKIGTQVWMAENLKATKYQNGDLIGTTPSVFDIRWEITPKYQWAYNRNESNVITFGRLYTWNAVTDNRNLCPTGWHASTYAEWQTLITYLGGESLAGSKLKETGTIHWSSPNDLSTNESGFTALPGGSCTGTSQAFGYMGSYGHWWTSTEYPSESGRHWLISSGKSIITNNNAQWVGFSVRCLLGYLLPSLTTTSASVITKTTAECGGNISNSGEAAVTAYGVCWNTTLNPTILNSKSTDGSGTGAFVSSLTGLTPNTTYYIRAYATSNVGTAYGNEISFNTKGETGTISDIDGNTYSTLEYGSQTWMTQNLRTTKYNNGDPIGTTTPATLDISGESIPKYQWAYNGIEDNVATFGRLYTWYAATDSRNVCPTGWHAPTDIEWTTLTDYLKNNGYGYGGYASYIGKSMATKSGWTISSEVGSVGNDQATNNSSGFSAPPGGLRGSNSGFGVVGVDGSWLSTTEINADNIWTLFMEYWYSGVSRLSASKKSGNSIRCIKDF